MWGLPRFGVCSCKAIDMAIEISRVGAPLKFLQDEVVIFLLAGLNYFSNLALDGFPGR